MKDVYRQKGTGYKEVQQHGAGWLLSIYFLLGDEWAVSDNYINSDGQEITNWLIGARLHFWESQNYN